MKKKWMILFLLVSCLFCSCAGEENSSKQREDSAMAALKTGDSEHTYTITDEMEVSVSFSEALAMSDSIVVGEFISQTQKMTMLNIHFGQKKF